MPSPVAHIGAALAAQLALTGGWSRRVAVVAAWSAIAPDLDIAFAVFLPHGLDFHRGPTHSLLGATLLGLAWARLARLRGLEALVVVAASVLHVPFDWSTGDPGAPARYGVPLFWPLSTQKYIAAEPWFGAFHIDQEGFLANLFTAHAVEVYAGELGTVLALLAIAAAGRRTFRRPAPAE
jgi:hypothetical protein